MKTTENKTTETEKGGEKMLGEDGAGSKKSLSTAADSLRLQLLA